MKTKFKISFVVFSFISAIALPFSQSPTLANGKKANAQANQIQVVAQQSDVETQIRQLTKNWIDGWSPENGLLMLANLLLKKRDCNWVIVHENIWGPVNE